MDLGERIEALYHAAGFAGRGGQRWFAALCGVNPRSIQRWNAGQVPTPSWVLVLLDCMEREHHVPDTGDTDA